MAPPASQRTIVIYTTVKISFKIEVEVEVEADVAGLARTGEEVFGDDMRNE